MYSPEVYDADGLPQSDFFCDHCGSENLYWLEDVPGGGWKCADCNSVFYFEEPEEEPELNVER